MEPIYFGSTNMSKLYAGGTEIVQVYYNGTALLATGNPANMAFVGNTATFTRAIDSFTINNSSIYVAGVNAGGGAAILRKYDQNNLSFLANSTNNTSIDPLIRLTTNNGIVWGLGEEGYIARYYESNATFIAASSISVTGKALAINNGFVYMSYSGNVIRKYHENNLAFVGNTPTYNATINSIAIFNGNIYVGGTQLTGTNRGAAVYRESNLTRIGNTVNAGNISSLAISNGYLYLGGVGEASGNNVDRFYAENRVFVDNTPNTSNSITNIALNNGYLYVGRANGFIDKYSESNLSVLVGSINTGIDDNVLGISINNGYIFTSVDEGSNLTTIRKYYEQGE
jgi:hypothetical protein